MRTRTMAMAMSLIAAIGLLAGLMPGVAFAKPSSPPPATTEPTCNASATPPVVPPCVFQGFEIDGNTKLDTAAPNVDWQQVSSLPGFTNFADCVAGSTDPGCAAGDNVFGQGSKESDQTTWNCLLQRAPQKNDLSKAQIWFETVNGVQYIVGNFTRVGVNGSAHIDYEFNKASSTLTANGCSGLPVRAAGDVLIAFDTVNGGAQINVTAYKYDGTKWVTIAASTNQFAGTTNIAPSLSDAGVAAGAFGEAALDLTHTVGTFTCGEFGAAWMKTRAAVGGGSGLVTDGQAEVKDYIGPRAFDLGNCPNVTWSKTADKATVNRGDQIGFTLSATNSGSSDATTVAFSDPLPNVGGTWSIASQTGNACTIQSNQLSCNSITLAKNGGTYAVHVVATTGPEACGTVSNTATFSSANAGSGTKSASVTVTCPNVTWSKTADKSPVNLGEQIGFTLSATNAGNGAATGVSFSDTLPNVGGTWTIQSQTATNCSISGNALSCTGITLAANGGTYSVHVVATTGRAACGTVNNTGTFSSTNAGSDSKQASVTVTCPNVSFSKIADPAGPVNAGDAIGFTLSATNTGTGPASGVTFSDDLPSVGNAWSITSQTGTACSLSGATGSQKLSCAGITLAATNGTYSVHVSATTTKVACPSVTNTATFNDGTAGAANVQKSATVVVNCPNVTISKVADQSPIEGGSQIGFKIYVTNSGPGTASNVAFTDPLPGNGGLNWSLSPAVTGCSITGTAGSQVLSCSFASLAPNTGKPLTIHIISGTTPATCGDVTNPKFTATVGNGDDAPVDAVTVHVNCHPDLQISKAFKDGVTPIGSAGNFITYTITYSNSGNGDAHNVTITDEIPAGTEFSSCSNDCTVTGTPPVATWNIGTVGAGAAPGTVTLTVEVLDTVGCQICNVAKIASPDQNANVAISSNNLCVTGIPAPHPDKASANGSAFGADVTLAGNDLTDPNLAAVSSSQSGVGSDSHNTSLASVPVPADGSILQADLLQTASTSTVSTSPAEAKNTSIAKTLGVKVLNVITADVVSAVATTTADGTHTTTDSTGSTFKNLVINGVPYTDVKPNTKVDLPVLGAGSYAILFERTVGTGLSDGRYTADLTVNMIHVYANLAIGKTEVIVSHAQSHAEFPQITQCTPAPNQSVSGDALVASVQTNPTLVPVVVGAVSIPPTGGHDHQDLASASVPGTDPALTVGASVSDTIGSLTASDSSATTYAQVADVCLLRDAVTKLCTVAASVVNTSSHSVANSAGAHSDDNNTHLVVTINGTSITDPAPNTVIDLGPLGFVILNEHVCDNGVAYSSPFTCEQTSQDGTHHAGLTVTGIRLVLLGGTTTAPGGEIIVSQSHSDATWRS